MMDETTEIVKAEPVNALEARSPAELVARGREMANVLAEVIEQQRLYADIQGRKYVTVEGWTTLLAMLGVRAIEVDNGVNDDGDYIATVELHNQRGDLVGRATAGCGSDEPTWADRPRFARRSMAATRAISKAARENFSWIVTMSGFQPTPAEEMEGVRNGAVKKAAPVKDGATGTTLSIVRRVQSKEGETNGRKWVRFGVQDDQGTWYSTFDTELADEARSWVDAPTPVTLVWTQTGKFKTLEEIRP